MNVTIVKRYLGSSLQKVGIPFIESDVDPTTLIQLGKQQSPHQWFSFSQTIGEVTLKITCFYYLKISFLYQSIRKALCLVLNTEALHRTPTYLGSMGFQDHQLRQHIHTPCTHSGHLP